MQMTSNCCGGGSATSSCDSVIAELPRYYPRQLITPADLTLEQNYFRDRMRRHNRLLHGWGVVCGALVCPMTTQNSDGTTSFTPWQVQVQPGYVLGPYGDEIILDCSRTVDLRTSGVSGVTGEPCIDAPDPWCAQVFTPPSTTGIVYVAVQYTQTMTRPVRVQPVGCGCDDTSCEYSRWHDGYQIGVLQTCPPCNACDTSISPTNPMTLLKGDIPQCPDCSCGPWVCLAKVTLGSDGSIQQIDNCSCRRLVLSLSTVWWKCTNTLTINSVTSAGNSTTPVSVQAGGSAVDLIVAGTNLEADANAIYSFGPGVTVNKVIAPGTDGTSVTVNVTAAAAAATGNRNLIVRNADCSTKVFSPAIKVTPPSSTKLSVPAATPAVAPMPPPAPSGSPPSPPATPPAALPASPSAAPPNGTSGSSGTAAAPAAPPASAGSASGGTATGAATGRRSKPGA